VSRQRERATPKFTRPGAPRKRITILTDVARAAAAASAVECGVGECAAINLPLRASVERKSAKNSPAFARGLRKGVEVTATFSFRRRPFDPFLTTKARLFGPFLLDEFRELRRSEGEGKECYLMDYFRSPTDEQLEGGSGVGGVASYGRAVRKPLERGQMKNDVRASVFRRRRRRRHERRATPFGRQ